MAWVASAARHAGSIGCMGPGSAAARRLVETARRSSDQQRRLQVADVHGAEGARQGRRRLRDASCTGATPTMPWCSCSPSPRREAGKGYLRVDKNFFQYDPTVGKWERKTERERIGGTNSPRSDFDESRLAMEYDPKYEGEEKLGAYTVHKILLNVKAGVDTAYPVVRHLGRQGEQQHPEAAGVRALREADAHARTTRSGRRSSASRSMPTSGSRRRCGSTTRSRRPTETHILTQEVDLRALEPNMFTKAWLEGKSR